MKNSNTTQDTIRPFGTKDRIGYALGDCANNLTYMMMNSYLLVFYTKVLGIAGAVIGTIFLLLKIVDAFTDVVIGRFCDTWRGNDKGRFSPVMRFFAIPCAVFSILLYNYFIVDLPYWSKITYVVITYMLYGSVGYTGTNIPYGSMASVITGDIKQRNSLSIFRTIGASVGGLVLGILIPMIIYVKDDAGNSIANGPRFLILAVVFGVLAVLCYNICASWCVERVRTEPKTTSEKANFLESVKIIVGNKPLMAFAFVTLFVSVASNSNSALVQYLFLDYFKDPSLVGLVSMAQIVGIFVMAPFAGKIVAKFGKKEVCSCGLAITAGGYLVAYFTRVTSPIVYILMMVVGMFGFSFYALTVWAMLTDCIDHQEVQTGTRNDGTIYACYSFLSKLAAALSGSIGGWTLTLISYDNMAAVQSDGVVNAVFSAALLIPGIAYLATALMLAVVYPLSKKRVDENAKILENR